MPFPSQPDHMARVTALLARVDEETAHAERLFERVGDGHLKDALRTQLRELDAIDRLLRDKADWGGVAVVELALADLARRRLDVDRLVSRDGNEGDRRVPGPAHLAFSTLTGA